MPSKYDSMRLNGLQDRRRKLTDEQREEIRKIYKKGEIGTRKVAEMYGVSRDLIRLIVDPDRKKAIYERSKEHWRDYQMSSEDRKFAQRKLRAYKKELYEKGELA